MYSTGGDGTGADTARFRVHETSAVIRRILISGVGTRYRRQSAVGCQLSRMAGLSGYTKEVVIDDILGPGTARIDLFLITGQRLDFLIRPESSAAHKVPFSWWLLCIEVQFQQRRKNKAIKKSRF